MDRIRKKIIFICALAVSASLLLGGMKVFAESIAGVNGELELGAVDITLDTGASASAVLPGQSVSCRPVIRNRGYSCYVRVSFEFNAYGDHISVSGMPASWFFKESDGKWYCREPLKSGEEICVFDQIIFDSSLPPDAEGTDLCLLLKAEAVQIRNFEPDPASDDPWQNVRTEIYSGTVNINVNEGIFSPDVLGVTYRGGAEGIVTDHRSFFQNVPVLMPGDEFTQSAFLNNNREQPVSLYFYSESDPDDAFLNASQLTISTDSLGILYEGPLSAASLNGRGRAVLISALGRKGTDKMTFSIKVPETLSNKYALRKSAVKWIFAARTDESEPGSGLPEPEDPEEPAFPAEQAVPDHGTNTYMAGPVRTGDENSPGFFMILVGSSLMILSSGIYLTGRKRKGTK